MKKRRVAVFDIDGTIFRSSLVIELVEGLIIAGIFPEKARRDYAREYERWLNRQDSYDKYIYAVIKTFDKNIRGVKAKKLASVARKVVSFRRNRLYRYTRDLLKDLKKKNYYLLAISHSPMYIVGAFGKSIGFNKVYGRMFEIDERGCFTGAILHKELIDDKAKILKRAVLKENLTLKGSVGVGDTDSDIPFLKLVEKPVCFNPNSTLFKFAKQRRWPIIVERKDVIYRV